MRRVVHLTRSTVGKKILMAITGAVLVLFVIGHMIGNLKVFQGREAFNGYAEWIREAFYPVLPHMGALWLARIVLLGAVLVHIWAAFATWSKSRAARSHGYREVTDLSFSYASRTMRWGGVILLLFIVYHILHFTTGHAYVSGDFVKGDVYGNFVTAFRNPLVLGAYAVAQLALCFHLYHGVWSGFQTLGANHPRLNPWRRPLAGVIAAGVFVGFMLPPVSVFAGAVGGEVARATSVAPVAEVVAAEVVAGEAGPADRTLGDEAPGDQRPGDQTPGDQGPGGGASGVETPATDGR